MNAAAVNTGTDLPGFADPVTDAQASFRAVLAAVSRPGEAQRLDVRLTPPAPLGVAAAAILLSLADHETSLWIDAAMAPARGWIGFHCGAAAAAPAGAGFVLAAALPGLAQLNPGGDETPENSGTIILQVAAIGQGREYRLSGPGLRVPSILRVDGLPDDFIAQWQANHALYPRGVDLLLCAGDMLAALPRSTWVEEG